MTTLDHRLVPIVGREYDSEPTHHTERNDFNLCTYVEPMITPDIKLVDLNTGLEITFDNMFTVCVVVFWMGHPVQHHLLVNITEEGLPEDMFEEEVAKTHSQFIHETFGRYIEGTDIDSNWLRLRALGWSFLSPSGVLAVKMSETRAFNQVAMLDFDIEAMHDFAEAEDLVIRGTFNNDVNKDLRLEDTVEDPLGVNLNPSISSFLEQLEKGEEDEDDE